MSLDIKAVHFDLLRVPNGSLIGFVSITFNPGYTVRGIGLHTKRSGGLRLVYPSKQLNNQQEMYYFYPSTKQFKKLEDRVNQEYQSQINGIKYVVN